MSKNYFLTPEEMQRKKARNKFLFYASLVLLTILFSTLLTFLANGF